MNSKTKSYVVCGIIINAIIAGTVLYGITWCHRLETMTVDTLIHYRNVARIICYILFPTIAIVTTYSAFLFWKLKDRK